jgi:hypothetical protein
MLLISLLHSCIPFLYVLLTQLSYETCIVAVVMDISLLYFVLLTTVEYLSLEVEHIIIFLVVVKKVKILHIQVKYAYNI